MSILRNLVEQRSSSGSSLDWGSSAIPRPGAMGAYSAGMAVNESLTLSIPTVFTCINIIQDSIAQLPLRAYIRSDDHSNVRIDPEPPIVAQPWPDMTRQDWMGQVMVSLLLRGNAYGFIASRDNRGYPSSIQIIHPDNVMARRIDGKPDYRINGHQVPAENVMHIRAMSSPGDFLGLDPITYMAGSFGLAKAAEKFGGAFFQNSAMPSGVLETPMDLSERETLELARAWKASHGGYAQAQLPAVLTGGVTWRQISLAPDQAQFLGSRAYSAAEICAWFRVPEHLALGNADRTTSWGVGVESMALQFQIYTLGPWMTRIESQLNDYLPPNMTCRFDLTNMVRAPSLERYQRYTLARNAGILSINEIRAMEDLPALPGEGGDDHMAPLNFAPVDSPVFQDPALKSGGIGGGIEQSPAKGDADAAGTTGNPKI